MYDDCLTPLASCNQEERSFEDFTKISDDCEKTNELNCSDNENSSSLPLKNKREGAKRKTKDQEILLKSFYQEFLDGMDEK